MDKSKEPIV